MPDREKAIRILEGNYKNFVLRHNGELLTVNELIALLKAQEPVEPHTKREGKTTFFLCGGCNNPLCIAKDSYKPKHCPECGRKVKWE